MTAATAAPARPTPGSPRPEYEGLFREPVYADGQPYEDGEEDDERNA